MLNAHSTTGFRNVEMKESERAKQKHNFIN